MNGELVLPEVTSVLDKAREQTAQLNAKLEQAKLERNILNNFRLHTLSSKLYKLLPREARKHYRDATTPGLPGFRPPPRRPLSEEEILALRKQRVKRRRKARAAKQARKANRAR